jgi:pyruvate formate lyase activating enzyme
MTEGQRGYCNLREVKDGRVVHRFSGKAVVSWYFDPIPTNCVADWVCGVEEELRTRRGLKNLAVFYGSCNSNCLFCQNSSYRTMMAKGKPLMSARELASVADEHTTCVCYFGGDPACNPKHSLRVSEILREEWDLRVCYETNGNISGKWLDPILKAVQKSDGTLKVDLKAITPTIYTALTGVSNATVLSNFKKAARKSDHSEGANLVASVLLVPGYIDVEEVALLCRFIADCDTRIPTALLGFQPGFLMSDLPRTSRAHAEAALEVAKATGLEDVRIGNLGLLGRDAYRFD